MHTQAIRRGASPVGAVARGVLLAALFTAAAVIVFALVLSFARLRDGVIRAVTQVITLVALYLGVRPAVGTGPGRPLLPGLTVTIPLTAIAFSCALVIAVIVALVQFAQVKVLRKVARFYIWIFRGTPLLVQLFVVFFGLSRVGILLPPFPAAVIVFSLNEGAYCAETVRAALESVPKGQLEAGLCAGLSYLQTIFRIVLPQAMRTAFPPLSNSLISMVKDTSLAANITVTEMFMVTQRIVARTYEPLLLYLEVGLIYLIFSTVLTKLQGVGESKLASRGHKEG